MLVMSDGYCDSFKFPAGEIHTRLKQIPKGLVNIAFKFDGSDSIMELLLINNALIHAGSGINKLTFTYFPFGRQDRIAVEGESLSLEVFCNLVNSLNAKEVVVYDPHSDVIPALLNNCTVIHQHDIFKPYFAGHSNFYLVSPDGGALKKIYKLASIVTPVDVVECSKKRNVTTGEVTDTIVHFDDLGRKDCYIVDDICDGGRTFIEIAKKLKSKNAGKITLMVTHGLFTKGLDVFNDIIDYVITLKGCVYGI